MEAPEARTIATVVLVSAVTIYVLHAASAVIVPALISLLLAYALEPFVELLMRLRLSRPSATVLTFMLLAILIGSIARSAVREVDAFLADVPKAIVDLRGTLAAAGRSGPSALDHLQSAATEIEEALGGPAAARPGVAQVEAVRRGLDVRAFALNAGVATIAVGARLLVVVALTFLLLCTGRVFRRKAIAFGGGDVIRAIDAQIQRFLVVRLLISGIVATATAIGLWIAGMSHAIIWGMVAGVFNILPFVGPSSAVALITLTAFLQFKALAPTAVAGGTAAAIAALEGHLITPWLTSRASEVNIVALFVSVLFCGWMWDMWGLLLAIPIMVAVKAAADHIEPLQPIGEFLGR